MPKQPSSPTRDTATANHPVLCPLNPVISTPAMLDLENQLTQWLWTGATGAVIAGASRSGKTTSFDEICSRLRARNGRSIPVLRMTMPLRDQKTVLSVYRQLCWAAGLNISGRHTADELAVRYLHLISDVMAEHGLEQALLVVDECQRLSPLQFNVFAELYDRLRSIQKTLMTVFVGNDPETWRLIDGMDSDQYAHIHGRFFLHRRAFSGIQSAKEVSYCLAQYDALRYPEKSGRTYVEAFLPQAVAAGFRLASASNLFWRVFRGYQQRFKIGSWGMQSFSITTNTLLSDFLPRYGVDELGEAMIDEAIRLSGLVPSLVTRPTIDKSR